MDFGLLKDVEEGLGDDGKFGKGATVFAVLSL